MCGVCGLVCWLGVYVFVCVFGGVRQFFRGCLPHAVRGRAWNNSTTVETFEDAEGAGAIRGGLAQQPTVPGSELVRALVSDPKAHPKADPKAELGVRLEAEVLVGASATLRALRNHAPLRDFVAGMKTEQARSTPCSTPHIYPSSADLPLYFISRLEVLDPLGLCHSPRHTRKS